MNVFLRLLWVSGILVFCFISIKAAPVSTNQTTSFRLIIELQDGSKIIGKNGDDNFQFHSDVLGEMKLPLERIRSIACQPKTNSVQLTTANGDTLTAQFVTKVVRVETAFGNFKLPVSLIKHVQVSPMGKPSQTRSGLVALWSGEGNANDIIGNNNGTLVGGASFAAGEVGQAFLFNTINGGITVPASGSLNVGTNGGLTLEAWIYPTAVANPAQTLLAWIDGTSYGAMLKVSQSASPGPGTGCLFANVIDVNGNNHYFSSAAGILQNNVFQQVALTYDQASGVATIYRNGVIVAQQNLGSFTAQTSYPFVMGTAVNAIPANTYSGLLDEVSVYNRALSASEIQTICTEENN